MCVNNSSIRIIIHSVQQIKKKLKQILIKLLDPIATIYCMFTQQLQNILLLASAGHLVANAALLNASSLQSFMDFNNLN